MYPITHSMKTSPDHKRILSVLSRIPVLTYHKIENRRELGINCLTPQRLAAHIEYLANAGFRSVTFRDILSGAPLPARPLIITFDDGYESVYVEAFPLLQRFGFRAVVFVIAGFLDRWNDWDLHPGRMRVRHLSREQIGELESAGWEIGAHGLTHRALAHLPPEQVRAELGVARERLSALGKEPVVTVAYPFGIQNAQVRELSREAGYVFGCCSVRSLNRGGDLMQIPRIPVYQFEGVRALKRKLKYPALPLREQYKLHLLSLPALLTPIYQRFFRKELFLDQY